MSEHTIVCLICGESHTDLADRNAGCPTMQAAQASDARPGKVAPNVYAGYLNAREALRAKSPQAAVRGLRLVLSTLAQEQGAQPNDGFSVKIAKLRTQGVISPRIGNALLKQALSDSQEEAQAWALLSIAEHAFYQLYIGKGRSG